MNVSEIFDKIKGSQTDIAKACGTTRQAVSLWKMRNKIPLEYVLRLSKLSGIPCHEISPEYFPIAEAPKK